MKIDIVLFRQINLFGLFLGNKMHANITILWIMVEGIL